MANRQKLSDNPITEEDLLEFVNADSDFGFEMRVLKLLRTNGFTCSHSGTYVDPVTDKIRQFDIRASKELLGSALALAVECKNLRPSNPLLLSAVPRTDSEALHDVIVFALNDFSPSVKPIKGGASRYRPGEMVGKKTDQVARMDQGLSSDDEVTFGKLHQAVNSCQDLIRQPVVKDSKRAIAPVLVVPTGLLWQVDYDLDGTVLVGPRKVDSATLFFNHAWPLILPQGPVLYRLSHIEIVTLGAVVETAAAWLGPDGFFHP